MRSVQRTVIESPKGLLSHDAIKCRRVAGRNLHTAAAGGCAVVLPVWTYDIGCLLNLEGASATRPTQEEVVGIDNQAGDNGCTGGDHGNIQGCCAGQIRWIGDADHKSVGANIRWLRSSRNRAIGSHVQPGRTTDFSKGQSVCGIWITGIGGDRAGISLACGARGQGERIDGEGWRAIHIDE